MTPWLQDPDVTLYHGDCLEVLRELPAGSVHMCATSPPFYGLRDYGTGEWEGGDADCDHTPTKQKDRTFKSGAGVDGRNCLSWTERDGTTYRQECPKCGARRVDRQIGLEETPDQWVERLVAVFREVRRVLRDDGTLWVEIGDSYGSPTGSSRGTYDPTKQIPGHVWGSRGGDTRTPFPHPTKPKDLLGQPWLLAFALRNDGWYLRSEIIWARPNPMPESVTDRPTKSHSTVFLLSKQPRYFYDADAIREQINPATVEREKHEYGAAFASQFKGHPTDKRHETVSNPAGANARSVWTIPTEPTPYAHFATWPQALVRRMILAGTSERGCCPECGAPWVRKTKVEQEILDSYPGKSSYKPGDHNWSDVQDRTRKHVATTGWNPSCDCHKPCPTTRGCDCEGDCDHAYIPATAPAPCTVLDPFAGSGTTSLVARNHGRHSIGIELNQQYLEIAAKRLQQLSLFASAEPAPVMRGHKGLTGGAYNPPGQSPHSNARQPK